MTTPSSTDHAPRSSTASQPPPTRGSNPLRLALAISAPIAPAAMGLSIVLSPYGNSSDAATILQRTAVSAGSLVIEQWLTLLIGLALIPGVIAVGLAALPRARRLSTVGLLIAVPGWTAGLLLPDADNLAAVLTSTSIDQSSAVRVLTSWLEFDSPALGLTVLVFVAGHIVGTVLLGLALYRSRAVWRWIAVALTLAQPLHFVAFVLIQSTYLDVAASWLTALGFGAAGIALLRPNAFPRRGRVPRTPQ